MCFCRVILLLTTNILLVATLTACGGDLNPSGNDIRADVEQGIPGHHVGQFAPDFNASDSTGQRIVLSEELVSYDAVVLYYTMWCPTCDSHMSHMRKEIIPYFQTVRFFAVDYVSGSIEDSRHAQLSNGYAGTDFTVIADIDQVLSKQFNGTMGTAVVIAGDGTILMNEDYKNGAVMETILGRELGSIID